MIKRHGFGCIIRYQLDLPDIRIPFQHRFEQRRADALPLLLGIYQRQYRIILSADTASEVRQMLSQKRR